jgi:hypothetical protein
LSGRSAASFVFENERASQVNQQGEEVGCRGQTGSSITPMKLQADQQVACLTLFHV